MNSFLTKFCQFFTFDIFLFWYKNVLTDFYFLFRIIELCQEQPDGITDAIIMKDLPLCSPQQRVTCINKLLSTVSHSSNRQCSS